MSVESATIKDCILVVHDVMTPLRKLLLDCMERQYGSMLPKAESEKYTIDDGNMYCCDCVGENVFDCLGRTDGYSRIEDWFM